MTDTPEIERIRAALEAGPTPGPWRTFDQFDGWCDIAQLGGGCTIGDASLEDGEYVASCNPAAMTAVLAHIDAQAADMARVSAELGLPPTIGPAPGYLRYLMETNRAQAAEIEKLRADAARYQWLRDPCFGAGNVVMYGRWDFGKGLMSGAMLDRAIDAAINAAMKEQP